MKWVLLLYLASGEVVTVGGQHPTQYASFIICNKSGVGHLETNQIPISGRDKILRYECKQVQ